MKQYSRRDFVNVALGASAGGLLASLPGCGSSPSDPTHTTPGTPNGTTSNQERADALNAISTYCGTLAHTSFTDDNQRLLTFLGSNPAFSAVGIAQPGSVWALFNDGTPLTIVNDGSVRAADVTARPVPVRRASQTAMRGSSARASGAARLAASGPPNQLPTSKKAFFCNALGTHATFIFPQEAVANAWLYKTAQDDLTILQEDFEYAGYDVSLIGGSPESLKTIRNADVLYIFAHTGWVLIGGKQIIGLNTSLPVLTVNGIVDVATFALMKPEIDAGRAGFMMYPDFEILGSKTIPIFKSYYSVTPAFIKQYLTFSARSFVFLNGCLAFSETSGDLAGSFAEGGAGAYAGWDSFVNGFEANDSGIFLMETLVGIGSYYTADPPLRAFAYPAALDLLKATKRLSLTSGQTLSYGHDESDGKEAGHPQHAKLVIEAVRSPLDQQVGILAPSIAALAPSGTTLTIGGIFGDVAGTVTIGGVPATVLTWAPEQITVRLPAVDQAGAAGIVLVTSVGGIRSNPVALTMWNLTFNFTATYDASTASTSFDTMSGSYTVQASLAVTLRGDIHGGRATPLDVVPSPLFTPQIEGTSYPSKAAKLSAYSISGTITHTVHTGDINNPVDKTVTETSKPDGSAPYPYDDTNNFIPHQQSVLSVICKSIDRSAKKITLLVRAVLPTYSTTLTPNNIPGVAGFGGKISSHGVGTSGGDGTFTMSMDIGGNIQGGSVTSGSVGENLQLSWTDAGAVSGTAPDLDAAS